MPEPEKTPKKANTSSTSKANAESADSADLYVGVQAEINGNIVNLAPLTPVNKIEEKGLKLGLTEPLELGSLETALPSVMQDLGYDPKNNAVFENGKLKKIGFDFIDNVLDKALKAELTIHALQYEREPVKTSDKAQKESKSTTSNNGETTEEAKKTETADSTSTQTKNEETTETPKSKYAFVASATWPDKPEDRDKPRDFFKLRGIIVGVVKGYEEKDSTKVFADVAKQMKAVKDETPKSQSLLPAAEN